ncbi:MAG: recombinase family protein [Anaeromyxobacteraceae bacterium]
MIALPVQVIGIGRNGRSAWPESALAALGVEFVSVTEPFDTTTPQGRLLLHLVAAFAEFERGVLVERTRAGLAAARRRGAHIGRPRIQVDRTRVIELHKAKKSIRQIAREMQIGATTVHRLLKNTEPTE